MSSGAENESVNSMPNAWGPISDLIAKVVRKITLEDKFAGQGSKKMRESVINNLKKLYPKSFDYIETDDQDNKVVVWNEFNFSPDTPVIIRELLLSGYDLGYRLWNMIFMNVVMEYIKPKEQKQTQYEFDTAQTNFETLLKNISAVAQLNIDKGKGKGTMQSFFDADYFNITIARFLKNNKDERGVVVRVPPKLTDRQKNFLIQFDKKRFVFTLKTQMIRQHRRNPNPKYKELPFLLLNTNKASLIDKQINNLPHSYESLVKEVYTPLRIDIWNLKKINK